MSQGKLLKEHPASAERVALAAIWGSYLISQK